MPLENSTDGRITDTFHMLVRNEVQISAEIPLAVHHCLLGRGIRCGIRRVYSKPQALSQCRNWLAEHLPGVDCEATASTTAAAEQAAADPEAAAIASREAGVQYGLDVLAANIEDQRDNVTRFAVLAQQRGPRTGNDKTLLLFQVPHEPGALANVMSVFKRSQLNLTWIESFPLPGRRHEYFFLAELQGHADDARVRRAMVALQKRTERLEVLGSFAVSALAGKGDT